MFLLWKQVCTKTISLKKKPVSRSTWLICKHSGSPAAVHHWVNQVGNSSSLLPEQAWTWKWRQHERTRFNQQIKTAQNKQKKKKNRRRQGNTQEIGSVIFIAAFRVFECVCECVCAVMWFWWIMSLKLPRHWDFSTFKAETVRMGECDQPWCLHGRRHARSHWCTCWRSAAPTLPQRCAQTVTKYARL